MKKINFLESFFYVLCILCFLAAINAIGFILPDDPRAEANFTGFILSLIVSLICGFYAKALYKKYKFRTTDESPKFSDLEKNRKK